MELKIMLHDEIENASIEVNLLENEKLWILEMLEKWGYINLKLASAEELDCNGVVDETIHFGMDTYKEGTAWCAIKEINMVSVVGMGCTKAEALSELEKALKEKEVQDHPRR